MASTDNRKYQLLEELVSYHNKIVSCEMELDVLSGKKKDLVTEWFEITHDQEHDELEGVVVLVNDEAYVINLSKDEDVGEQPHYNADIQKMRVLRA